MGTEVLFDEQGIIDYIRQELASAFSSSEWKAKLGKKKVKFVDENFGEETSFPVIYIEVTNCVRADGTYDSSKVERFTHFDFIIEFYTQDIGETNKAVLGREMSSKIISVLTKKINPHIIENRPVPSPDETLYRRVIEGYGIVDNIENIFYR